MEMFSIYVWYLSTHTYNIITYAKVYFFRNVKEEFYPRINMCKITLIERDEL